MSGERKRGRPHHPDVLTPGEWRIAHAIRFGMTNRQIAERRGVSVEAVKFHASNILLKLDMTRRQDLLGWTGMPAADGQPDGETQTMEEMLAQRYDEPLIPPGFTRLFPYLLVPQARIYLRFLVDGLGGEIIDIHAAPDGRVRNAHIRFGDTKIMVGELPEGRPAPCAAMYLYVADADAAMARACAAGGEEISVVGFRPYGERQGGVRDPAGNVWWLSQRLAPGPY